MARKSKTKFKMKGHTLPGINQKTETVNKPDGRSESSAFQMQESGSSPNKIVGLAAGALLGQSKFGKKIGQGIKNLGQNLFKGSAAGALTGGSGGGSMGLPPGYLEGGGASGSDAAAGAELLKAEAKEAMEGSPITRKKKLRSGSSSTVGGELGGSSYKTETPFNQNGDDMTFSEKVDKGLITTDGESMEEMRKKEMEPYKEMNDADLFMHGKHRDKEGKIQNINWAPNPISDEQIRRDQDKLGDWMFEAKYGGKINPKTMDFYKKGVRHQ